MISDDSFWLFPFHTIRRLRFSYFIIIFSFSFFYLSFFPHNTRTFFQGIQKTQTAKGILVMARHDL